MDILATYFYHEKEIFKASLEQLYKSKVIISKFIKQWQHTHTVPNYTNRS